MHSITYRQLFQLPKQRRRKPRINWRLIHHALMVFTLTMALGAPAMAASVTLLTLADFTNPRVLDFESAPLGNISGMDPLFTNFGISKVSTNTNRAFFNDRFAIRPNSSRALWQNSDGLAIVDPGSNTNASRISYTLEFSSFQTKLGVGWHDQGRITVNIFSGATLIGNPGTSTASTDLSSLYFETDRAFNRVTIETPIGGFPIDNITLEASSSAPIPEPSTMLLFGSGLVGLAGWRYRMSMNT